MTRSYTVRLPSARRLAAPVGIVAALLILLVVAFRVGMEIAKGPVAGSVDRRQLQQIVVQGGTVYVGRLISETDGWLRIEAPTVLRQNDQAAPGGSAPPLVVQALTADPFAIDGPIVLRREMVIAVGNVVNGTGLERAYQEATGTSDPTAAP